MLQPIVMLLVDDDDDDAALLLRIMRDDGLANRVVRVENGIEAIDFLLACGDGPHPDLILLDLYMPQMDGFEFLEARAQRPELEPFRDIPVVAFTISDSAEDIEAAYAAGATSYLVKPIGLMAFRHIVILHEYWLAIVRDSN